jgi:predicted nucleotidyltransferase
MKFHAYLEQVLGTKAGISILRSLVKYKGKIFTVRGLARDADVSSVEASRTIKQLEQYGIVRIQPVGKAYQVSLNGKSYVLDKIVEPIFTAEGKTLEALVKVLKKYLDTKKIISAAIFGSVAKGEEREDSDIDLLVISDDRDYAYDVIGNVITEVSEIFYGKIAPIVFSKKEFIAKKRGNLVSSILDNHIMILGIDLEKITK